jgi:hypothetical protein
MSSVSASKAGAVALTRSLGPMSRLQRGATAEPRDAHSEAQIVILGVAVSLGRHEGGGCGAAGGRQDASAMRLCYRAYDSTRGGRKED